MPPWPRDIRRTVRQWTGIPVSVGIGPTKTLAKAANQHRQEEPRRRRRLDRSPRPRHRSESPSRLPVGDVWGIGRQWAKLLEGNGITTALAFSRAAR